MLLFRYFLFVFVVLKCVCADTEAPIQCFRSACDDSMGQDCCVPTPEEASSGGLDEPARCKNGLFVHYTGDNCNRIGLFAGRDYVCCDRLPDVGKGQCKATGQYCDSSIGGDCCTSKNSGDESPRCKDNLAVTMTGADCYFGLGNDFVCCDGPQGPLPSPSSTATLTGLLGLISATVVAFVLV